jgi:hypothetical protein
LDGDFPQLAGQLDGEASREKYSALKKKEKGKIAARRHAFRLSPEASFHDANRGTQRHREDHLSIQVAQSQACFDAPRAAHGAPVLFRKPTALWENAQ